MEMLQITTPDGRVYKVPNQRETRLFYEQSNLRKKQGEKPYRIEVVQDDAAVKKAEAEAKAKAAAEAKAKAEAEAEAKAKAAAEAKAKAEAEAAAKKAAAVNN